MYLIRVILAVYVFCYSNMAFSDDANSSSEPFTPKDFINATLFLSQDPVHLKVAARSLTAVGADDPVIYDLAAEKLIENVSAGNFDSDTHAWFFKALASSGSKRYESIIKTSYDSVEGDSKLSKYYTLALAKLSGTEAEYQAGSVDEFSIEKRLRLTTPAAKPGSIETLLGFENCTPSEKVFELFGYPNAINVGQTGRSIRVRYIRIGLNMTQLVLDYADFADVMLTRRVDNWCYLKSLPYRPLPPTHLGYSEEAEAVILARENIWVWDQSTLPDIAGQLHRVKNAYANEPLLDEIMLRVWYGREEKDSYLIRGLINLLQIIYESKNPRYLDAMQDVADVVVDPHLVKFTRAYIKKNRKKEPVEQFNPMQALTNPYMDFEVIHDGSLRGQIELMSAVEIESLKQVMNKSGEQLTLAILELIRSKPSRLSLDVSAEMLYKNYKAGTLDEETHILFIRMLSRYRSMRHLSVIDSTVPDDSEKSLLKWRDKARIVMTNTDDSYQLGEVNLDDVEHAIFMNSEG